MRLRNDSSIELEQVYGLGVDSDLQGLGEVRVVPHTAQGLLQCGNHLGLTRIGLSYQHQSVSHRNSLMQLNALALELFCRLQAQFRARVLNGHQQNPVVYLRQTPREQIRGNAPEQRNIIACKLRQIHVIQRPQGQYVFIVLRELHLQIPTVSQNRFDCTHTETVVVLRDNCSELSFSEAVTLVTMLLAISNP